MAGSLPVRKKNRLPLEAYKGRAGYALTVATHSRRPWFREEAIVQYCVKSLAESAQRCRFSVYAFCFMPDHVHLLVGGESDDADLVDFVKRFKQSTGWWFLNRYEAGGLPYGPVWEGLPYAPLAKELL
jgi:putative transposase